jgi:maleylacetate reductase
MSANQPVSGSITHFTYVAQPARVIFGAGSLANLVSEIERLGARRALVLCTAEQRDLAQKVSDLLGRASAGIFDRAVMHVPIEVAREAQALAQRLGADCAVAVGGGSTTGLGKAIALDSGLPILCIPTTYAGSEVTSIYGITEGSLKKTGRDARCLPRTVIYDPVLTLGLPVEMSITSGINAIAHAAEGLYAPDRNPITDLIARDGIAALVRSLPAIRRDASNLQARSDALYGAWLCGTVLGSVGMGLHHKLCHTLGGSWNLPHAQTHTIMLPHALAYNAGHAPGAMASLSQTLGVEDPALALYALAGDNGAPVALRDIGMREADLDRACDLALQAQYANPRPLERAALATLLRNAFEGRPPAAV